MNLKSAAMLISLSNRTTITIHARDIMPAYIQLDFSCSISSLKGAFYCEQRDRDPQGRPQYHFWHLVDMHLLIYQVDPGDRLGRRWQFLDAIQAGGDCDRPAGYPFLQPLLPLQPG